MLQHNPHRAHSVYETGLILGVSRVTIHKLIKEKRLASFKIQRRRLISAEAIEAFVRAREAEQAGA
jgi:excisionase family DNA binding protein